MSVRACVVVLNTQQAKSNALAKVRSMHVHTVCWCRARDRFENCMLVITLTDHNTTSHSRGTGQLTMMTQMSPMETIVASWYLLACLARSRTQVLCCAAEQHAAKKKAPQVQFKFTMSNL